MYGVCFRVCVDSQEVPVELQSGFDALVIRVQSCFRVLQYRVT